MVKVAPSILSADFNNLERDIKLIEEAGADYVHIDVMDGRFVPNISFGPVVIKGIQKITALPLDVHLMIVEPEKYIDQFIDIGASIVTVQAEATDHLDRALNQIKEKGVMAAVSINPSTSVESIYPVLSVVDMVLIMSVNPGFGGQKFIPYSLDKIKQLKQYLVINNLDVLIEVDGGVTEENAGSIANAGADILVAGSTVYRSSDIPKTIKNLQNAS